MRFRPEFGLFVWGWVAIACLYCFFAFEARFGRVHSDSTYRMLMAVVWILTALLNILGRVGMYWELDATSLRQRGVWGTKEISWAEVTRVGTVNPKQPSSGFLEVDYARPTPLSDRGHILANQDDRDEFIRALHRFAPQATFEV